MKKIITSMLAMLMVISMITGCSSKDTAEATKTDEQVAEETTDTETTEPESNTEAEDETTATKTDEEPVELTIMAAASLTDVTKEIADLYKTVAPNVTLTFSYGSSGALQTQIEEGAPADIFMSAATKQMDALVDEDLVMTDTRKDLLVNKVVLIVPKESTLGLTSFEDVGTDKVKTIALGEPEGVPVGQYAEQVFTSLELIDTVKTKANYGSDVRQVLTWVESGEVDCGVVYSTDAKISDKVDIICEAPQGSHKDIIYPVAVLGSSSLQKESQAFIDFLSTDEAAAIFENYGFSMK